MIRNGMHIAFKPVIILAITTLFSGSCTPGMMDDLFAPHPEGEFHYD